MLLGCIADDLTGATDLALMLASEGLRVVQTIGPPPADFDARGVDVVVAALKSRSIPAADAVDLSLQAALGLREAGARQLFFKYCSTFDSTDAGNIGPVAEALLALLGGRVAIACPAFPRAGRTVYMGHLFVDGVLLSDSPMRDHPLNPMRDADLRRVLARQTRGPVGHVTYADVEAGPLAVRAALLRCGGGLAIVDALSDRHLRTIGQAVADMPLITGGSGVAMGLPAAYVDAGLIAELAAPGTTMAAPPGRSAILAGSCSTATRRQVAAAIAGGMAAFAIDADDLASGRQTVADALAWIDAQPSADPILLHSSASPDIVGALQARIGREAAGALVEGHFAALARELPSRGIRRLLVAGGETSGAVVHALGVRALAIGPEIAAGVPWTRVTDGPDLALALKSGNFGADDMFMTAWAQLS